ncbi:MAG: Phosphopantothenoylcysteine decarboxylase / Phosphopantothenoylcysteine synthetase [uncultured Solirubrobacteraceae bacterium]|uniref:Coenzyme A biosynthesis bifunctional protein CoaBC n=1 Tax=uncultured Solirubrobacteraceae bacterium TaxID=1162706 RepID=A0A6J4SPL8_9ACTN|nr:MAG: Phosphopantothenoylcysteine decarboxylase / Phosphopantothenoylcysteine synthetase [uncultured Solirubrobacteraceae bacterium]
MGRILLGVTGGIAAYKAVELARLAVKAGHAVRVIQTEASTRFVGTATFAAVTGAPVLITEWERDPARGAFPDQAPPSHDPLSHLELVASADVFIVAPASANTIAKLAHGLADNLLTAAALASPRPLIVAPAMNHAMYEHPATAENLATLRARGAEVLDPGTGALGSLGEWGVGRLPEPPELLAACERRMAVGGSLDGLRVLVTAGGTREPIDAVRFVGNRSSGRMGFALAEQATRRGARVTVVAANVALPRHPAVEYVDVTTAAELGAACAERFADADVLLMAAAVADFRPAAAHDGKLKKDTAGESLRLDLERTPDVLSGLAAARRPEQTLIGFAAEHGEGAIAYGRGKLERKGLDAVVVNDVAAPGIGFDTPDNEVTVLTRSEEVAVPRAGKDVVAGAILDVVLRLRSETPLRVAR